MPQPIEPQPQNLTDVEKLLALVEKWRAEPPLGDEGETVAELDRALVEDPVRFHDLSEWPEGDE